MLRAALDVIAERGFPDTRIADVAERVGVSPALVIYYFKTKDHLLTEAMRLRRGPPGTRWVRAPGLHRECSGAARGDRGHELPAGRCRRAP